jgi:hypothetical protein
MFTVPEIEISEPSPAAPVPAPPTAPHTVTPLIVLPDTANGADCAEPEQAVPGKVAVVDEE